MRSRRIKATRQTVVALGRRQPFARARRTPLLIGATALVVAVVPAITLLAFGGDQGAASPRAVTSSTGLTSQNQPGSGGAAPTTINLDENGTTSSSGANESKSGSDNPSTPRASAPFATAFDVSARFGSACVRSGDRQTITVTTRPGAAVAYHAQYSDGKDALDPGYYGGNNGGTTDDLGMWTDAWVVAPSAPPGRVRVDVVAQANEERGYALVFFDIADSSGRCAS